jgi:hypothetical protein
MRRRLWFVACAVTALLKGWVAIPPRGRDLRTAEVDGAGIRLRLDNDRFGGDVDEHFYDDRYRRDIDDSFSGSTNADGATEHQHRITTGHSSLPRPIGTSAAELATHHASRLLARPLRGLSTHGVRWSRRVSGTATARPPAAVR